MSLIITRTGGLEMEGFPTLSKKEKLNWERITSKLYESLNTKAATPKVADVKLYLQGEMTCLLDKRIEELNLYIAIEERKNDSNQKSRSEKLRNLSDKLFSEEIDLFHELDRRSVRNRESKRDNIWTSEFEAENKIKLSFQHTNLTFIKTLPSDHEAIRLYKESERKELLLRLAKSQKSKLEDRRNNIKTVIRYAINYFIKDPESNIKNIREFILGRICSGVPGNAMFLLEHGVRVGNLAKVIEDV